MRIPLHKTYRAFPELDRFSDEQCERFLQAATYRVRDRSLHQGVLVILTVGLLLVTLQGAIGFTDWLGRDRRLGDLSFRLVSTAALGVTCLVPGLAVLIVKDRLLLRRIRFVLEDRAVCPSCRYSLLGMVVDAGNTIVCPECGKRVAADPSLNELVKDEAGRIVYRPSEHL